jgi:exonuclease VII large subunit
VDEDKLRSIIFEEAQRQAAEIMSSAEEEIAKLREDYEKRMDQLRNEAEQRKQKSLESTKDRWQREIEYEKRLLREQKIAAALEELRMKIESELVSDKYADAYTGWLVAQVPDAQEWSVQKDYVELQHSFSKRSIKFNIGDTGVKAQKGSAIYDLSPEVVSGAILEKFSHELYEQLGAILP